MSEHEDRMDERDNRKSIENYWKWIAMVAIGIIVGMLKGEILPSRNVVTADQLAAHIATEDQHNEILTRKMDELKTSLDRQEGYLKGATDAQAATPWQEQQNSKTLPSHISHR